MFWSSGAKEAGEIQSIQMQANQQEEDPMMLEGSVILNEDLSRYGEALLFRSSQQEVWMYLDDEVFYRYDKTCADWLGKAPPSIWNLVMIPPGSRGKELRIVVSSPYQIYAKAFNTVYFGKKEDLIQYAMNLSVFNIILSWLSIVMGSLELVLWIFWGQVSGRKTLLQLGIIQFLFGFWSWGESASFYYHFADPYWERMITVGIALIIPYFFAEYYKSSWKQEYRTIISVYEAVVLANFSISMILQFAGILDLLEGVRFVYLLIMIGFLLLLFAKIKGYEEESFEWKEKRLYTGFFFIACCIEVITYMAGIYWIGGSFIRLGVIVYMMGRSFASIEQIQLILTEKVRLENKLEMTSLNLMLDKMKPHFIYNTMVAIQELCYADAMQAADAIGLFARYLRRSMEKTGIDAKIPFLSELEYIRNYIEIQQMCYEDKFSYQEELETTDFVVPPLTIQPIVENAVSHGVLKKRGKGTVWLKVKEEPSEIIIIIEDDGIGYQQGLEESRKKEQMKWEQKSIHSEEIVRYRLKYLVHSSIEMSEREGGGTCAVIRLEKEMVKGYKEESNESTGS